MAFEENEISVKSNGGTELVKRGLASRVPKELADEFQIICSRVRELEEDKIRVYWLHDLPEDPEASHLKNKSSRDRFHHLVFCSNWQYDRYRGMLGIPYDSNCSVIDNAIVPFEPVEKPKDIIRLVYSSTPQRGLSILVPVFEKLAEKYDNIVLDVFSSFKIYGWAEADKQYEPLYERCRNHPRINYHSFAPNEVVRECLKTAHIHAYPSIWMETSGISVIEAMSAGLLCVHPNYGGLIDTTGNLTYMYQGSSDINKHANIFYQALDNAVSIVHTEEVQHSLRITKLYADARFNWGKIAGNWIDLLTNLKDQYSTPSSRVFTSDPGEYFVYNT